MSVVADSIARKIAVIDMEIIALREERHKLVTDLKRACPHDGIEYALGRWVRPHQNAVNPFDEYYAFGSAYCADCDSFFAGEGMLSELAKRPDAVECDLPYMRHIGKHVASHGECGLVQRVSFEE